MRIAQSETAIAAHHRHVQSGAASAQCERILSFIEQRGGDWSIGEVAQALDMEKSTVSARIHHLLHDTHELVEAKKRKDRVSGVTVRPVRLPEKQRELAL